MYSLKNVDPITVNEILSKVTQEELWRYYCNPFKDLNSSFKSIFYNDTNPSCRIIRTKTGKLYYKDFGNGQYISNIFDFVKLKYSCTFTESLQIIANDFNIRKLNFPIKKELNVSLEEKLLIKPKSNIKIIQQNFTKFDFDYFNKHYISLKTLKANEVISCRYVYLNTIKGSFKYEYNRNNPIYRYKEYDIDLNFIGYRLYFPGKKYGNKFLNSSNNNIIQGIKNLPEKGELLIITKSLKDVMVLTELGYNAISLASETIILKQEIYNKLKLRFNKIISLYDNDETGIKFSKIMENDYGIKAFYIPEEYDCKDISEVVFNSDLEEGKKLINKLISTNE